MKNIHILPKQETLEEVDWKVVYEDSLNMQRASNAGYESKIAELQEQIKRMYSEEEILELVNNFEIHLGSAKIHEMMTFKKWFERFKKK